MNDLRQGRRVLDDRRHVDRRADVDAATADEDADPRRLAAQINRLRPGDRDVTGLKPPIRASAAELAPLAWMTDSGMSLGPDAVPHTNTPRRELSSGRKVDVVDEAVLVRLDAEPPLGLCARPRTHTCRRRARGGRTTLRPGARRRCCSGPRDSRWPGPPRRRRRGRGGTGRPVHLSPAR